MIIGWRILFVYDFWRFLSFKTLGMSYCETATSEYFEWFLWRILVGRRNHYIYVWFRQPTKICSRGMLRSTFVYGIQSSVISFMWDLWRFRVLMPVLANFRIRQQWVWGFAIRKERSQPFFGHSVGLSHYKCWYSLQPNCKFGWTGNHKSTPIWRIA